MKLFKMPSKNETAKMFIIPTKLVNFIIVEHNEIDINKTFKNINNNKKEFIKNEKI